MRRDKFRTIIHCLDASSGYVAKVPLADGLNPLYAIIDEQSYKELENLECSFVWHIHKQTGRPIAWGAVNGNQAVFIDRIIADCKVQRGVISIDRNPLNMRRSNLAEVHSSKAKTNARDPDRIPRPKRITRIIRHYWDY
jgi:hypothetical protein